VRGTVVSFRKERLLGSVVLVRSDGRAMRAAAESNARELDRRIAGVLAGTITGKPVAIPKAPATNGTPVPTTPPEGAPDIRPAALAPADFVHGAPITAQRYPTPDSDAVVALEREFGVGSLLIGKSRLISLENDVTLYKTAIDASTFFAAITAIYKSPGAGALLSRGLRQSDPSFKASTLVVGGVRSLSLGNESTIATASFDSQLGKISTIFAFVRVGRVVSALIATGPAARMHDADVVTLLGRAAKRAATVR
jgi:hypothetical protein